MGLATAAVRQAGATGGLLIIEDDDDIVELLTMLLAHPLFSIASAANGVDGLEKALRLRPAAILLDLQLPMKDGFAVLAELRRANFSPRILIMSAKLTRPAMDLGAYACIDKPFDVSSLRTTVLRALEVAP